MILRAVLVRIAVVVLFVPAGLACLWGFSLYAQRDGTGLLDDTLAFLGSGAAEGVPGVSMVHCVGRSHGGGSRSMQLRDWACVVDLAPRQRPAAAPPAGMTPNEVVEANLRRMAELRRPEARVSNRLERVLASNRTGEIPTLRRLSAEGEPPRYGLVWGVGELAGRWLQAAFQSAFLLGIGVGLLFLSWWLWRRAGVLLKAGRGSDQR